LFNSDTGPLELLTLSSMVPVDITVYPDSNKVGLFGGSARGDRLDARTISTFLRRDAQVDYWDGEAS
jgi:hypothetical protein